MISTHLLTVLIKGVIFHFVTRSILNRIEGECEESH